MGNWVFGCDVCQEVCPYNRVAPVATHPGLLADAENGALPLAELLTMDEARFRARFRGTPLLRSKRRGLARNACVAAGNSGDPTLGRPSQPLLSDDEPLVRGHAAWALGRLGGCESISRGCSGACVQKSKLTSWRRSGWRCGGAVKHGRVNAPIVVVGAGAAGLTAAIWATVEGRRAILLEGTLKPGQKILISGGGRCNVLPVDRQPRDFHTDGSPNTLRKILAAWPWSKSAGSSRRPRRTAHARSGERQGISRVKPLARRARCAAWRRPRHTASTSARRQGVPGSSAATGGWRADWNRASRWRQAGSCWRRAGSLFRARAAMA